MSKRKILSFTSIPYSNFEINQMSSAHCERSHCAVTGLQVVTLATTRKTVDSVEFQKTHTHTHTHTHTDFRNFA
jgi:hypothetical protein